jgi:hypothetical protein
MIDAMPSGHAGTTDGLDTVARSESATAPRCHRHRGSVRGTQGSAARSLQRSPLVFESACQLRPAAAEAADPLTGLGAHHVNRLAEAELPAQGPDVTVGV